MKRRRTRKQKANAKHTYSVSWDESKEAKKGEEDSSSASFTKSRKLESSNLQSMSSIKKDLAKSVIVFVIIMSALVVYSITR